MGDKSADSVKVAVRIRPLSSEEYEKDGEIVDLLNPKQQLLLGGQMSIAQPSLEPMAKLEVVSA